MDTQTMPPLAPQQPAQPITTTPISLPEEPKRGLSGAAIALIIVSIITAGLIALAVYLYIEYDKASTNLNGQINAAVATAVAEQAAADQAEFEEKEKYPFETFAGPEDYGELSFEFPKTWSVYIAKDAATGGDFEAYLNPAQVNPVSSTTITALRVTIKNQPFDNVIKSYDGLVKAGKLSLKLIELQNGPANRYDGDITTNINGTVVLVKIRDKTAILQSDSKLFAKDFEKILSSVTFNS